MNIMDLISQFTDSSTLSSLGAAAGTSNSDQVSSLLSSALPMLLQAMTNNSQSKKGASSLAKALDDHAADKVTSVSDSVKNADAEDGSKIISKIFGSKTDAIEDFLASKTNLSKSQVDKILSKAAPVVMSLVGSEKNSSGTESDGISSLISSFAGGNFNLGEAASLLSGSESSGGISSLLGKLFGNK